MEDDGGHSRKMEDEKQAAQSLENEKDERRKQEKQKRTQGRKFQATQINQEDLINENMNDNEPQYGQTVLIQIYMGTGPGRRVQWNGSSWNSHH